MDLNISLGLNNTLEQVYATLGLNTTLGLENSITTIAQEYAIPVLNNIQYDQYFATLSLNSTLDDYPRELSYKAKFFYSFFFVVLPLSLQTGAAIHWVYIRWNKKVNDKRKLGIKITLWIKLWLILSSPFLAISNLHSR